MRSPLALLVAALLLGASSARAVECSGAALQPAQLDPACGAPKSAADCKAYQHAFIAACMDKMDAAQDALQPLSGLPTPTPDQQKEIARLNKTVSDVNAIYKEAVKTSEEAQKLPPGDSGIQRFGATERDNMSSIPNLAQAIVNSHVMTNEERNDEETEKPPNKSVENSVNAGNSIEHEAMSGPAPDVKRLALAGKVLAGAGEGAGVNRVAQEIIKAAPGDPHGPNLAARAAMMNNRPDEAADWARKALALDPANDEARRMLGYSASLLSKSRLKGPAAKPGFDESAGAGSGFGGRPGAGQGPGGGAPAPASPAGPGTAAAPAPRHLTGAQEKAAVGDFAGAYDDLTRALTLYPDDDAARIMRAEDALAMGNPVAALADADQLLAKHPHDARAMRARASALLQLGRLDEALATVDRAILLEVMAASGHLIRAQILEKLGRPVDAAAEYREAARLDPALTPVAQEALRRLGFGAAAPSGGAGDSRKLILRGVFIAIALALLLAGLLGGAAKLRTQRPLTTTSSK